MNVTNVLLGFESSSCAAVKPDTFNSFLIIVNKNRVSYRDMSQKWLLLIKCKKGFAYPE